MATALRRPVSHDEHLSLVEHLDELRSRLIICVLALVVCFGITFWQNEAVLNIVNAPLEDTQNLEGTKRSNDPLEQNARFQIESGRAFAAQAQAFADRAPAVRASGGGQRPQRGRAPRVRGGGADGGGGRNGSRGRRRTPSPPTASANR